MIATVRRVFRSPWTIAGALFLLALAPRVIGLGSYVTHDEPFWLLNSIRCVYGLTHGDMSAAFQSAHPGVPPLIGHGALLWLYYTATGHPEVIADIAQSGWVIWFPPHLYHLLPDMIAVAGLFTAVVSALTVAAAYLLVRRLSFGGSGPRAEMTALCAGLLLAVDPYFLALSRVVGVDAALAGFMLLSALLLLVYMADPSRSLALLGTGALMALAFLTKTSAGFLIPFTVLTLVVYVTFCLLTDRPAGWTGRQWIIMSFLWTGGVVFALLCLWPAAWQNPGAMFTLLFRNIQAVVVTPHEGASYFFGQFFEDPGWFYYWVVLLFRLTPLTLPLGLLGVLLLVHDAIRRRWRIGATLMFTLLVYIVLFLAMMSLAAKKQERYILPAIVAIDVLAAWALVRLLDWLARVRARRWLRWGAVGLILLTSLWWFRLHPHYYAYQNPLVGGSPVADWVYMTGWGEGNELAAAYLNQRPDAADLVVVASYDAGVAAYTPGVTLWPSPETLQLADYAVLYNGITRRRLPSAEVVNSFADRQPEHIIYLDGIPYVQIYRLTPAGKPRRLLSWRLPDTLIPPQFTMIGKNIAYRGYAGDQHAVKAGDSLALSIYWQCIDYLTHDYTVFAHLVDPHTGQRWGQWDSVPVHGLFPTSWWMPGLVIRDDIRVPVDPAAPPGEYELWVGLYDVKTGARLRIQNVEPNDDHFTIGPITVRN